MSYISQKLREILERATKAPDPVPADDWMDPLFDFAQEMEEDILFPNVQRRPRDDDRTGPYLTLRGWSSRFAGRDTESGFCFGDPINLSYEDQDFNGNPSPRGFAMGSIKVGDAKSARNAIMEVAAAIGSDHLKHRDRILAMAEAAAAQYPDPPPPPSLVSRLWSAVKPTGSGLQVSGP